MRYKLTNTQVLYVLSKVGEDVVIDIPDMPSEVEWKPRTKGELMDQWDDITEETEQSDWDIQARTDDIAQMLEEGARIEKVNQEHGYAALILHWAQRIRELK